MPRLPSLTPKQLIKKLKKLDFTEEHTTGSHIILYHAKTKRRAVIPYHLKDIPKGTLHSLLKEAGVSVQELSK